MNLLEVLEQFQNDISEFDLIYLKDYFFDRPEEKAYDIDEKITKLFLLIDELIREVK